MTRETEMINGCSRRDMLKLTSAAVAGAVTVPGALLQAKELAPAGVVVGEPMAAKIGQRFLSEGANAVDALVATALAACITSPGKCGIGGYGGHAVIAPAKPGRVVAIDFNSTAPAAARENMFALDEKGKVIGRANVYGWRAAGVPGTLAGLHLALQRHGTRSFRDVLAPAIELCEEGVSLSRVPSDTLDASRNDPRPETLQGSEASAEKQRNPGLARLLKTLAAANSVEPFYRGDIARRIAETFRSKGGEVTFEDMASYQARSVDPLTLDWNGMTIHTAPLTAAGLISLEAISILKALEWRKISDPLPRLHAKLEALRLAWADRLQFFGDPAQVDVPVERLLSVKFAQEMAGKVRLAVEKRQPIPLELDSYSEDGTIHISAVDGDGNMAALTLTHGGGYGARVSVEEFGLVLGHGMSRFDPRPGRPNSPGPGKRPVNNMAPAVVMRGGAPVLALGAGGGTRIPNSVFEVLLNYVGLGTSMETAMNAPRLQTTGTLALELESVHAKEEREFFKQLGYRISIGQSAFVSAVSFDPNTGTCAGMSRREVV